MGLPTRVSVGAVSVAPARSTGFFDLTPENERTIIEMTITGFFAQRITEDQLRDFDEVTSFPRKGEAHAH